MSAPTSHKGKLLLNREGLIWGLSSLALLLTGLVKNINLLTLLACFMIVLPIRNFFLARKQLRKLVVRRLPLPPIFADTPFLETLELHQKARGPAIGVHITEQGKDHGTDWFVPRVEAEGKMLLTRELTLPRRGRYSWNLLHLSCGFPFGLLGWQTWQGDRYEGVVLPRLGQLQRGLLRHFLAHASPTQGQERAFPRQHPAAQTEFHGLRLFRPGDSPRWIHWRTSARRGELMVREFEDMPSDHLLLLVDLWLPAETGAANSLAVTAVETTIALAATLCWDWCRQKGDRFLLAVAGQEAVVRTGLTGRDLALNLLECLAVQEGCPEPSWEALLNQLGPYATFAGPILLLSTRSCPWVERLTHFWRRPLASINVREDEQKSFFSWVPPAGEQRELAGWG